MSSNSAFGSFNSGNFFFNLFHITATDSLQQHVIITPKNIPSMANEN